MDMNLNPHDIAPLHYIPLPLRELVENMRKSGWSGRPLLVIEHDRGYQAWTGSQRIIAARKAELPTVPCYVLNEEVLLSQGVDAVHGHIFDFERLDVLRKVGDETAVQLMWLEGRDSLAH